MRSYSQILEEAKAKAERMVEAEKSETNLTANEAIEASLDRSKLDSIAQAAIDKFLKAETAEKPKRKYTKRSKEKKSAVPSEPAKPLFRMDYSFVKDLYEKSGLAPFKTQYWFYDDLQKYPLIQSSTTNENRTAATPIAAFVLLRYKELLSQEKPPSFLSYGDLDKPSNTWSAGRMSQVTGLNISYLLGFRSGYAGNVKPRSGCSSNHQIGFDDGCVVREQMIKDGLIDPDPVEDIYADEKDEHILSELFRVRGYKRK